MTGKKKKRDLIATFQHIEQYHRRRQAFVIHTVLSLAAQAAVWANWYGSYGVHGTGFDGTFFTDRFTVSVALLLVLAGHFALMYTNEGKDRLVIQALRQHEAELARYDDDEETVNDLEADEERAAVIEDEEEIEPLLGEQKAYKH